MVPETQEEEGEVTLNGEVTVETEEEAVSLLHLQTMPDGSPTIFMVNNQIQLLEIIIISLLEMI